MINRTQINKYEHTLKQNAIEVQKPVPLSMMKKTGPNTKQGPEGFQSIIVSTLKENNSECMW